MYLLDCRIAEIRPGYAVLELEPEEFTATTESGAWRSHKQPIGFGDGLRGFRFPTLERGVGYAGKSRSTGVRPLASQIPRVRCEAQTLHVGSRIITTEGKLCDERGKLYAHGTATFMLFQP
ncbi:MAG: PaaI family thioesterase [Candidatus Competibacteraceae bacterium]